MSANDLNFNNPNLSPANQEFLAALEPVPFTPPIQPINNQAGVDITLEVADSESLDDLFGSAIEPVVYPTSLLDWAMWCAAKGWYVFPCDQGGKEPATQKGVSDASNDPAQIRAWWAKNPDYNPAVALGPSNLVGYDFDSIAPYPDLPATLAVRSGRILKDGEAGGIHMYYRGLCRTHSIFVEPVLPITERNDVDKKGRKIVQRFDALNRLVGKRGVTVGEIRSRGAYLIAPGAIHKSGQQYTVINDVPLADSPEQNVEEAREAGQSAGTAKQSEIAGYVESAFDKAGIDYKERTAYKDGLMWLVDCAWDYEHSGGKNIHEGGSSSAVFMAASGALGYKCKHAHCEDVRGWDELRSWMETEVGHKLPFKSKGQPKPPCASENFAESGTSPTQTSRIEVGERDSKVLVIEDRPDMPRAVLSGRLGEICEKNMLDDFPVAYAWPSLVTAASVLVPERPASHSGGDNLHNLYTALVGPVNFGKSQAIEWAMKLLRVQDDPRQYSEVKAGSAERLLKYMNHLHDKDQLGPRVLMFLDEWKFFFDKAGIENSVFPTLLTTGFYRRNATILDSHGHPMNVPASFSWIGGIVDDAYEDCFSRVAALGLHDRFLHGVSPSRYIGFQYRPFEGEVLPEDFTPKSVEIDRSVWECLKAWRKANPQATREAELALRVAEICASFDGAPALYGKDLDPHWVLAAEQMKIRETLKPNIGETPDAQCAIKVENYLRAHGPAGEWLDLRVMMKAIHYERFGPNAFERTIQGLVKLRIAEISERDAGIGKTPGGRPAKVIRLELE